MAAAAAQPAVEGVMKTLNAETAAVISVLQGSINAVSAGLESHATATREARLDIVATRDEVSLLRQELQEVLCKVPGSSHSTVPLDPPATPGPAAKKRSRPAEGPALAANTQPDSRTYTGTHTHTHTDSRT